MGILWRMTGSVRKNLGFSAFPISDTPWKFNIDPEKKPSHQFSGAMLNFGSVGVS